jgi:hypothetical protein
MIISAAGSAAPGEFPIMKKSMPGRRAADAFAGGGQFIHDAHARVGGVGMIAGEYKDSRRRLRG